MMSTTSAAYDIEIQEALQNNVSSVTYRSTQNTPPIPMRVFFDTDIVPKLEIALRTHSSVKLTVGCKADLLKMKK